jgi:S1-C subfamily serine protease
MTPRAGAAAVAVVALAAAGVGGCGGRDASSAPPRTVQQTTKVEVLKGLGSGGSDTHAAGGFDPERIYSREAPGVVTVISAGLQGGGGRDEAGLGSGFVVSGKGEVLTNAHVVTSGTGARITEAQKVYVRFPDGNQVSARVRGYDPFADVALLRVDPGGLTLRPLPLGSTDDVKVGAPVAAIGSPFGEEQSLSVGVVSATDRSIQSLTGFDTTGAIQTDAAINHGNSGGPLLDAHGRVLGINSQIQSDNGDGTGVGFAVPVDQVRRSLRQLRADGHVRYAYLGVATRALYPQVAEHYGLGTHSGAWVQTVPSGGPAAKAGIRAGHGVHRFQEQRWLLGGDVIVGVEGHRVRNDTDLAQALLPYEPGQTVTLRIWRDGKRQDVRVKLGERPQAAPSRG